jgi:hypothetical protein
MDPVIDEMSHTRPPIRNDVFGRWAAYLVNVVQPQLDRLALLEAAQASDKGAANGYTKARDRGLDR